MYLHNWENENQMKEDFELTDELDGANVLIASYGCAGYEGDAFVLFEKGGVLYEVNGSHCSCYGLEGQWEPEETTKAALLARIESGGLGNDGYTENVFRDELVAVLNSI